MKYILALLLAAALLSTAAVAGECPITQNPAPRGTFWTCLCDQNGDNCRLVLVRG